MINLTREYEVKEDGDNYKVVITDTSTETNAIQTISTYTEIKGFHTKSDAYGYLMLTNLFK